MATCYAITLTGLPAISVPCGFTPGRAAYRLADRRTTPSRPGRAEARVCVRATHPVGREATTSGRVASRHQRNSDESERSPHPSSCGNLPSFRERLTCRCLTVDRRVDWARCRRDTRLFLNPHVRERFTKVPDLRGFDQSPQFRWVVHVGNPDMPRLALLNKTCRLCLRCETLIVDQSEGGARHHRCWIRRRSPGARLPLALARLIAARGAEVSAPACSYGTSERTWRTSKYLEVSVVPAHWERSNNSAGQPPNGASDAPPLWSRAAQSCRDGGRKRSNAGRTSSS